MLYINITEKVKTSNDMADLLRKIADMVEGGYISGNQPTWSLEGEEEEGEEEEGESEEAEKEELIKYITDLIRKHGEQTAQSLEMESSPVGYKSRGKFTYLVEKFSFRNATIVTYNNDEEEDEEDVEYKTLDVGTLREILDALEEFDAESEKTQKRCES